MRITDNLYLLSGAGYGQIGNVYAIFSNDRLFLIDTGEDSKAIEIINENLKYHKLDKYPITDVLITHMHIDHSANAWYFREKGARILAGASDASGIEEGGVRVNDFGFKPYRTCKVDVRIEDNQVLDINGIQVKAMNMPGHTNGSMFYLFTLDGKTMVCSGDTAVPVPGQWDEGYDASLGWMGSKELDKKKYIASLERSLKIDADVLLSGHGMPVMMNGSVIFKHAYVKAMHVLR